jgi:hypothetical protein
MQPTIQRTNDRNGQSRRSALTNAFRRVVFPFVEHRINLDALAHVLTSANPLVQELYIGTVEKPATQEEVEVNQLLTQNP